ncbi:hypothetical protein EJ05DRAFT_478456 [Pseudovirgaria hyperparasitica]|uniref:MARVEL domain-containing protein n=1 Tax=Pseudovirgaria hyperparasitica TaxID=470096 RepID=A0A6A6W0C8_9PEZI|nr:uncharacterized protein EJ05DRAFT_478456 [Pseudovirgaria hyperparasitica]KAF2755444.1 hypothetical protein EJ05DRAFT_478456 [Pseudovirgaria hyperparasitica]
MMPTTPPSLTTHIAHTTTLFQALLATPVFLTQGFTVLSAVFWNYYIPIEDATRALFVTLMAGLIVGIVLVQRRASLHGHGGAHSEYMGGDHAGLYLELIKSVAATAVWVWLCTDACVARDANYGDVWYRRVVTTGGSAVFLL